MVLIVRINDDPILRTSEFVGAWRIGVKGGEMPLAAPRVQDRKPGCAMRVETLRGDGWQLASLCFLPIFFVYIQQQINCWTFTDRGISAPRPSKHTGEGSSQDRCAAWTDTLDCFQLSLMGRRLQSFERIDIQCVAEASRQRWH